MLNWLPKACEAVLPNHVEAIGWMFAVNLDTGMDTPGAGLNCTVHEVKVRVVVNPVTSSETVDVDPVVVPVVATTPIRTGAAGATVNCAVTTGVGVRETPPAVMEKDGVMVMVLAFVPVCNPILVPALPKTALVLFAGMVNATVRPPLENCTAGSAGRLPDELKVRVPEIATG